MMSGFGSDEKRIAGRARKSFIPDYKLALPARDEIKFVFFVKRLVIHGLRREQN